MKMHLNDGEAYLKGRSPETAQRLLDAAKEAGLEGQVRTTSYGYIVPQELADAENTSSLTGRELDKGATAEDEARAVVNDRPKADDTTAAEAAVTGGQFNPSDHTVDDVVAHLDTVDADEHERILAAEQGGKARSTILNHTHTGA
jgi:hypothetical protein